LHLQQNEPEQALVAFESAYEVDPGDFETILALTDLYRQLDRHAEADSLLDQSMLSQGASIDQLIARAQPLYNRASTDAEAAQAATRLLERAVEINPNQPDVLLMLGDLRFLEADFSTAARLLQRALDQNPRDPQLWLRAASAHLEAGDPEEAARIADEGLLLFPGQLPLLRVAGYSLMQTFHNDEAIARFEEMLAIIEEDAENQQVDQSEAMAALGLLHARKQAQDTSDEYYQQALAINPDNTLALNNYAYSLAARDLRLKEALALAERAVEIDAENASYLDTLGWIHFKMEHLDKAQDLIGQALTLGDPTVVIYDHYGDVYARLGEWETARTYWRKALDLAPDNTVIQAKLERQQY
jgi:tetratricopeptide (TPR) repeat protein